MAMNFGRCFVVIKVVIPVQVVKWPHLMAPIRVDGIGMKIVPWMKASSSDFFLVDLMMLQDRLGVVVIVLARVNLFCWDKGMFQRPLDLFWVPLMSI